jgi:hypothetical protein
MSELGQAVVERADLVGPHLAWLQIVRRAAQVPPAGWSIRLSSINIAAEAWSGWKLLADSDNCCGAQPEASQQAQPASLLTSLTVCGAGWLWQLKGTTLQPT